MQTRSTKHCAIRRDADGRWSHLAPAAPSQRTRQTKNQANKKSAPAIRCRARRKWQGGGIAGVNEPTDCRPATLLVGQFYEAWKVTQINARSTLLDIDDGHGPQFGERAADRLNREPEQIGDVAASHRKLDRG